MLNKARCVNAQTEVNSFLACLPRFGRKEATRTPDPYVPNVVRYQLRYFPILVQCKVMNILAHNQIHVGFLCILIVSRWCSYFITCSINNQRQNLFFYRNIYHNFRVLGVVGNEQNTSATLKIRGV